MHAGSDTGLSPSLYLSGLVMHREESYCCIISCVVFLSGAIQHRLENFFMTITYSCIILVCTRGCMMRDIAGLIHNIWILPVGQGDILVGCGDPPRHETIMPSLTQYFSFPSKGMTLLYTPSHSTRCPQTVMALKFTTSALPEP